MYIQYEGGLHRPNKKASGMVNTLLFTTCKHRRHSAFDACIEHVLVTRPAASCHLGNQPISTCNRSIIHRSTTNQVVLADLSRYDPLPHGKGCRNHREATNRLRSAYVYRHCSYAYASR